MLRLIVLVPSPSPSGPSPTPPDAAQSGADSPWIWLGLTVLGLLAGAVLTALAGKRAAGPVGHPYRQESVEQRDA